MKQIQVNTGFGYFTKDGKVQLKAELPIGSHPAGDEFEYCEVKDKGALDKIEVYVEPPTEEELREQKIKYKMRDMAEAELIKEGSNIFYYNSKYECDFLIAENEGVSEAIQVCYDISDQDTKKREERGLVSACKEFKLKKGFIITHSEEQRYTISGINVEVLPAYKYLLSDL